MFLKPFSLAGALVVALAGPALAHDHGWHDGGWHDHGWHSHGWGGPSVDFDIGFWRGGSWYHGWHGSRFGWWWTLGPDYYYYYPRPIYPYPDYYEPPAVVYEQAPPVSSGVPNQQYWYYCDNPKGYYPYVSECQEQWRPVPVTPPSK